MAADGEVKVNIKVTADNKGGKETEKGLDDVEKKAKRSFKSIVGGIAEAKRATALFQKAVGALANFGFVLQKGHRIGLMTTKTPANGCPLPHGRTMLGVPQSLEMQQLYQTLISSFNTPK